MTFGKLVPLPGTADLPEIGVLMDTNFPAIGVGLGYLVTPRLEFRANVIYGRSEIIEDEGIGLAGVPLGRHRISKAESYHYTAGFAYSILPGRISPFLAAGMGTITIRTSELGSSTRLLVEYGGGIKLELAKKLTAFADIKDVVSFFDYPRDFDYAFLAIYSPDFSKSQHRLGVHFGLRYSF